MHRRTAISYLGACAAFEPVVARAQFSGLAQVQQKASAQRMLSQRMSKAYLLLGMGVSTTKARRVLDDSLARFERQQVELMHFAPSDPLKTTYADLQSAWTQYKLVLAGQDPHRDRVAELIDLDGKMMRLADQGTVQLVQRAGATANWVDLSARQGMWSQRAAKFFLVRAWQTPVPGAEAALEQARTEFLAGLEALEQARDATPAIRQELELARQQWVFFDIALSQRGGMSRSADHVFGASENLLSLMERVTTLYARLAA
jgi:hypothetical protein